MRYILLIAVLVSATAHAASDKRATQLRLFVGDQKIEPVKVNDVLTAGGLKNYKNISNYGIEGTYKIVPRVNLGARAQGKWQKVLETASTPANAENPYYSSIQQSAALGILRIDLVSTPVVHLDVFGGAGTSKTRMDIRTAGGDGKYSHSANSLITAAGASLGIGYGNIYFMVEAGQEWNRISSLTKSGATSTGLNEIDLSGTYANIGILFNGLPKWIHQK